MQYYLTIWISFRYVLEDTSTFCSNGSGFQSFLNKMIYFVVNGHWLHKILSQYSHCCLIIIDALIIFILYFKNLLFITIIILMRFSNSYTLFALLLSFYKCLNYFKCRALKAEREEAGNRKWPDLFSAFTAPHTYHVSLYDVAPSGPITFVLHI